MSDATAAVGLSTDLLRAVFPFFLAFDDGLRAIQWGRAVPKVCENIREDAAFADLFAIHRPRIEPTSAAFLRSGSSTFFLASHTTNVRMRGQVAHDAERGVFFFFGTPWFKDIDELQKSHLDLKDFTVQDPVIDFLYMVQAKTLALAEATKFSETIARQRDDLRQKNVELAAASAAKSQFLANTSHELRTPLNGIMGLSELLLLEDLPHKHRSYVSKILGSARSLLAVVNDVLDFSKIEAGKLTLDAVEFDFHDLVHEVVDFFATSAVEKGVRLRCLLDDDVPAFVRGDPVRLRQVLSNLVGNALKFTPEGAVLVRAYEVATDDECHRVGLSVTDTGIGIDAQGQRALFGAFSQVDSSMSRRYGGTGLGLAISKQLVELMGGRIGVESEPGKGSTFHFTVRLERSTAPVSRVSHDFTGVRVLLVDDDETTREHLRRSFEQRGAVVVTCDALGAVQTLEQADPSRPFQLAILDAGLPEGPAFAIARAITANPSCRSTRTIVLHEPDEAAPATLSACAEAFLGKPVNTRRLFTRSSRLLVEGTGGGRRVAGTGRASEVTPCRVLVVEDHPVNQEVAVAMLESLGYTADVASNGRHALEVLADRSYDVILMDLQMPEFDGYAATAEIRKREAGGKRTPIIALTAHAMVGDQSKALAAGMDDYVAKPLDLDRLASAMRRWAPAATASDAGARVEPPPVQRTGRAIDPTVLERLGRYRSPSGRDFVGDVIAKFLADLPDRMAGMRAAAAASDREGIARAAHALRSSGPLVGAMRLGELCGELEEVSGQTGREERIGALLARIEQELARVRDELTALRRTAKASDGHHATPARAEKAGGTHESL